VSNHEMIDMFRAQGGTGTLESKVDDNLGMIIDLKSKVDTVESKVDTVEGAVEEILRLLMNRIRYPDRRDGEEDLETLKEIYSGTHE